jgi:hypothetical protein
VRFLALLAAGTFLSCHASSNSIAGALVMTPIALGASALSRASGGCYAVCQQGERCNEKTGFCEALPCRGLCSASETCEEGFFGVKCLPAAPLVVTTSTSAPAPPKPAPLEKPKSP